MCKYLAIYSLIVMALGYAALDALVGELDSPESPHVFADNGNKTARLAAAHRRFRKVLDPTIIGLIQGKVKLRDAVVDVYLASREDSPTYLRMLTVSEVGATIEERIARNLIGHVADHTEWSPSNPSPLVSLQSQLEEMIAAESSGCSPRLE